MLEQVKLYDIGHWQHTRYNGFYWQGETIYNADNYQKPVIRKGKAPCALLDMCYNWQCEQDAIKDLQRLGFVHKDDIVWECV